VSDQKKNKEGLGETRAEGGGGGKRALQFTVQLRKQPKRPKAAVFLRAQRRGGLGEKPRAGKE